MCSSPRSSWSVRWRQDRRPAPWRWERGGWSRGTPRAPWVGREHDAWYRVSTHLVFTGSEQVGQVLHLESSSIGLVASATQFRGIASPVVLEPHQGWLEDVLLADFVHRLLGHLLEPLQLLLKAENFTLDNRHRLDGIVDTNKRQARVSTYFILVPVLLILLSFCLYLFSFFHVLPFLGFPFHFLFLWDFLVVLFFIFPIPRIPVLLCSLVSFAIPVVFLTLFVDFPLIFLTPFLCLFAFLRSLILVFLHFPGAIFGFLLLALLPRLSTSLLPPKNQAILPLKCLYCLFKSFQLSIFDLSGCSEKHKG